MKTHENIWQLLRPLSDVLFEPRISVTQTLKAWSRFEWEPLKCASFLKVQNQARWAVNQQDYIYIITLYQSLNLVFQNNGHRWLTVGPKIWTWSDSTVDKQILKQKTWNCVAGRQSAGLGGNFFQSRLWNLATLVFQELIDAPWQLSVCGILDRWSICIQDKTLAKGFALSLTCWCIQLTLAAGEPLAASMA